MREHCLAWEEREASTEDWANPILILYVDVGYSHMKNLIGKRQHLLNATFFNSSKIAKYLNVNNEAGNKKTYL